jgi:Zn-dependent M16 (insulinase) family peptidase
MLTCLSLSSLPAGRTLDVFSSVREWMKKDGAFQDKDIDEAKLRLFSSIDHPVAPSRQGNNHEL